jgi:hypothetical protein
VKKTEEKKPKTVETEKKTHFTEEFDFEKNLEKFNKEDLKKEFEKKESNTSGYNKNNFFDNISREVNEDKMDRDKQKKVDYETFGNEVYKKNHYRGRGRGGSRGGGRGRGRGGFQSNNTN